jgi:ATP-dependent exoDNAse (exonuclease V) beta subunit
MNITFISAGAGSGKTYRLTEILFKALHGGEARASGILATTFTKKAASELRERARGALLQKRAWLLASEIGAARIGTVNSVCGELIQRFAFDAGLATDLRVLDEAQTSLFIRQALDAVLDTTVRARLNHLSRKLGIQDKFTKVLLWEKVVQSIIQQARSNNIAPEHLQGMAAQNATDLLSQFGTPSASSPNTDVLNALRSVIPLLVAQEQIHSVGATRTYLALCREMEEKLTGSNTPWSDWAKLAKGGVGAACRNYVAALSLLAGRFLHHPELHQDITEYLTLVFEAASLSMHEFSRRKREMGVIDFCDQEQLLLQILNEPHVQEVLTQELDLLLVDEFQDTSPIQLAIFLKLASFAKKTYWVGDPKQSIYGFRGSDPALMMQVKSVAESHESLDKSWRTIPPLVNMVNTVFIDAFDGQFTEPEVRLHPERSDPLTEQPAFMHWLLEGNQSQQHQAMASAIQQLMLKSYQVVDKNSKQPRALRYGDIAILTRMNDKVTEIVSALAQANIPATTSQAGLLETPEAVLALACLRRVNNPFDTLATAEILALAYSMEPEDWLRDRLQWLAQQEDSYAQSMWREQADTPDPLLQTLAALRSQLVVLSPKEAMQLVITSGDLSRVVLGWRLDADIGRVRLANLQKLVTLAGDYEDQCYSTHRAATISGLLLWLSELADNEEDLRAMLAVNAVQVLTHHGSKGLEWPVIICNELTAKIRSRLWDIGTVSTTDFNIENPLAGRFIRYWPWPFGALEKVDQVSAIEGSELAQGFQQAADQEAQRLLYVSMTRARDMLIFVLPARSEAGGPWLHTLQAQSWLMPQIDVSLMALPNGTSLRYACSQFAAPENLTKQTASATGLFWFTPSTLNTEPYLPFTVSPSGMPSIKARVAEEVRLGERIPLAGSVKIEMDRFGTGLHACIAYAISQKLAVVSAGDVQRILTSLNMANWTDMELAAAQLTQFLSWIRERWQPTACYAEYPVTCKLENGQQLSGQIDLLLDTPEGWILIDHKANPGGQSRWEDLALTYSGQLAAYSKAIQQSSNRPVLESWLYMPVAAGAVRVEL